MWGIGYLLGHGHFGYAETSFDPFIKSWHVLGNKTLGTVVWDIGYL